MIYIAGYIFIGTIGGAVTAFFMESRCPTHGDLLIGMLVGATIWLPIIGLLALVAPFSIGALICEEIEKTHGFNRFRKWLRKPICAKT